MIQQDPLPIQPANNAPRYSFVPNWWKGFQCSVAQNTPAQKLVHKKQFTSFPKGGTTLVINFLTGSIIVLLTTIVVVPNTAITQTNTSTK